MSSASVPHIKGFAITKLLFKMTSRQQLMPMILLPQFSSNCLQLLKRWSMLFHYSNFPGKMPKVKFRLRFLSFFFVGVKSQISLKLVKRMREFDQSAYRYFFFFVCHRRIEHIGKTRVNSDIRLVLLISFLSTPRRSSDI